MCIPCLYDFAVFYNKPKEFEANQGPSLRPSIPRACKIWYKNQENLRNNQHTHTHTHTKEQKHWKKKKKTKKQKNKNLVPLSTLASLMGKLSIFCSGKFSLLF